TRDVCAQARARSKYTAFCRNLHLSPVFVDTSLLRSPVTSRSTLFSSCARKDAARNVSTNSSAAGPAGLALGGADQFDPLLNASYDVGSTTWPNQFFMMHVVPAGNESGVYLTCSASPAPC